MNEQLAKSLKELYRTNGIARAFLDHSAQRSYDQQETKVDRAMTNVINDGHQATRKDIVDLFQRLEAIGCGKFMVGRRGQESRFVWSISLTSAGKAATGEALTVDEIDKTEAVLDTLTHSYHLRSGKPVNLELPADLTMREAERLAAFIKSLPIEAEQ